MSRASIIQLTLFLLTICTTTIAGAEWVTGKALILGNMSWPDLFSGFHYSIPFLIILTCHEFGHYLTARYYNIKVTLPYYIPLWLLGFPSIGTAGAYIRIKEEIQSRKEYFDVGIAGPLAGFVIALGVLYYGFTHLPEHEHIFTIHPEYKQFGMNYADHVYEDENTISITLGDNIIFYLFKKYLVDDPSRFPHPNEIIHYPYLMVGFLSLFWTALNLLPIGQLDGGHVVFGLLGERRSRIASRILFVVFLFYAGLGVISPGMLKDGTSDSMLTFSVMLMAYLYYLYVCLYSMIESRRDRMMLAAIILTVQFATGIIFPIEGYSGWMLFALLLGRFLGVYHPPAADNRKLSKGRVILGIISLIIFVMSFSPQPLIIE